MSCENGECDHIWHYASPRTLAGALQHGLGRGAREAADDPAAPDLVMACVWRDYRWDWLVDEREVDPARLVRDLRLPVSPYRRSCAPLRGRSSTRTTPSTWPSAYWRPSPVPDRTRRSTRSEAMSPTAADGCPPCRRWHGAGRSSGGTTSVRWHGHAWAPPAENDHWLSLPWTRWASRDERIAAEVRASRDRPQAPCPFAGTPSPALLGLLRDPETDRHLVLAELRSRPPDPLLLELVEDLPVSGLNAFAGQLERLGPTALAGRPAVGGRPGTLPQVDGPAAPRRTRRQRRHATARRGSGMARQPAR